MTPESNLNIGYRQSLLKINWMHMNTNWWCNFLTRHLWTAAALFDLFSYLLFFARWLKRNRGSGLAAPRPLAPSVKQFRQPIALEALGGRYSPSSLPWSGTLSLIYKPSLGGRSRVAQVINIPPCLHGIIVPVKGCGWCGTKALY